MEVDAKSLCAIIKTCCNSGVSQLKFGDVEVTFVGVTENQPSVSHETIVSHGFVDDLMKDVPKDQLGEHAISVGLVTEQKKLLDDAVLVDLSISDPVGWENHCVDNLVHGNRSLDA